MAALNVDFPDPDMAALREYAASRGMTLKDVVRAATRDLLEQQRALNAGAVAFRRAFSDPALAAAITEAGIEDGPAATGRTAA